MAVRKQASCDCYSVVALGRHVAKAVEYMEYQRLWELHHTFAILFLCCPFLILSLHQLAILLLSTWYLAAIILGSVPSNQPKKH